MYHFHTSVCRYSKHLKLFDWDDFLIKNDSKNKSSKQVLHQLCIKIVWCSNDAGQNGIGILRQHSCGRFCYSKYLSFEIFMKWLRFFDPIFSFPVIWSFLCIHVCTLLCICVFCNCLYIRLILTSRLCVFSNFSFLY